jgi:hypothetical protein
MIVGRVAGFGTRLTTRRVLTTSRGEGTGFELAAIERSIAFGAELAAGSAAGGGATGTGCAAGAGAGGTEAAATGGAAAAFTGSGRGSRLGSFQAGRNGRRGRRVPPGRGPAVVAPAAGVPNRTCCSHAVPLASTTPTKRLTAITIIRRGSLGRELIVAGEMIRAVDVGSSICWRASIARVRKEPQAIPRWPAAAPAPSPASDGADPWWR